VEELTADQFCLVEEPLKRLGINTYFCQSVLAGHVGGEVFVDNLSQPSSVYILHSYGMSLVFGDCHNRPFNQELAKLLSSRTKDEWLQVDPVGWDETLIPLLDGDRVEPHIRQNFAFNINKYRQLNNRGRFQIVKTSPEMFNQIDGHVVPRYFWKDANLFDAIGQAFSVLEGGQIVATAFTSYVHDGILEIGIETLADKRGHGYGTAACVALIDYCLEQGKEPVWTCRHENTSSLLLAQKLGFEPTIQLPNYHLKAA